MGRRKQSSPVVDERLSKEHRFKRSNVLWLTPEVHPGSNVNEITLEAVIFNSARRVVCIQKLHHNLSKTIY
jgi:hypothetical protein